MCKQSFLVFEFGASRPFDGIVQRFIFTKYVGSVISACAIHLGEQ
jgi:hypothetical protein